MPPSPFECQHQCRWLQVKYSLRFWEESITQQQCLFYRSGLKANHLILIILNHDPDVKTRERWHIMLNHQPVSLLVLREYVQKTEAEAKSCNLERRSKGRAIGLGLALLLLKRPVAMIRINDRGSDKTAVLGVSKGRVIDAIWYSDKKEGGFSSLRRLKSQRRRNLRLSI